MNSIRQYKGVKRHNIPAMGIPGNILKNMENIWIASVSNNGNEADSGT